MLHHFSETRCDFAPLRSSGVRQPDSIERDGGLQFRQGGDRAGADEHCVMFERQPAHPGAYLRAMDRVSIVSQWLGEDGLLLRFQ